MTEDIIIGGVSIAQLRATKAAMQQDAVKFINSQIEAGKAAVAAMLEAETKEYANEQAQIALEAFEAANLVSGVTGVAFYLEYYEEYGDGEPLSGKIEDADNEVIGQLYYHSEDSAIGSLVDLLSDMESQSRDWHSSRC